MKKKIFVLLLSLSLIFLLAITVSAAELSANTDNKSCSQGSTVTLNVSLSDTVSAASGGVEVLYDSTKLELIEGTWHTTGAILSTFDMEKEKGAFAYPSEMSLKGQIFSVRFKVLSNAPVGDTEVKCVLQLKDASGNLISVTNNSGNINITCNHSFTNKTTDYLASPATCTSPAKYYYTCSICGAKGNTTHDVGSPLPHTFDKQVATSNYLVKNVTCTNEAEYYYSCECGAKGSDKFTADASWSHNFAENLFISADGHWHQCFDCGEKKDFAEHVQNSNNTCDKCQFVLSNDGTHYHNFGETWLSSDDAHWHECSCGLKEDMALHKWDAGTEKKPATIDSEGEVLYTCSDCGKTKTEFIDKLYVEISDEKTDKGVDESSNANPTPATISTGKKVLIASVGMLILLAVEAVGFVIYKFVKKKESNGKSENDNSSKVPDNENESDNSDYSVE